MTAAKAPIILFQREGITLMGEVHIQVVIPKSSIQLCEMIGIGDQERHNLVMGKQSEFLQRLTGIVDGDIG